MEMPGRKYDNGSEYRYGFNGKENDKNIYHGIQDYGMRIYDGRLGRFLSVDPLTDSYPWYTPYQFAGNKPIWAVDLDGLEELIYIYQFNGNNKPATRISTENNIQNNADGTFTNIKTGQQFDESQRGQVQYQYVDASGKALGIKRNYDGSYEPGEGDIMDKHQKGAFNTIYDGSNNPEYFDNDGIKRKDYRREPVNNLDIASLKHDKAYDRLKQKYKDINLAWDKRALPADKQLVSDLKKIVKNKIGENGVKNTTKQRIQAGIQVVGMFFYTSIKKLNPKKVDKNL